MLSNSKEIAEKIRRSVKAKDKALRQARDVTLKMIVLDAKKNVAENGSVATGELINSIDTVGDEAGVRANYAAYVEFGTKTKIKLPNDSQVIKIAKSFEGGGLSFGKMADNITDWARNKGIRDPQTIYKIIREIAKNGNEAHPFFFPAVFKQKHLYLQRIRKALERRI